MDQDALRTLIKASFGSLQKDFPDIEALSLLFPEDQVLKTLEIDEVVFSCFIEDMEIRLGGRRLNLEPFLNTLEYSMLTFGVIMDHLAKALTSRIKNPTVVYVDDEEENLFVFKRKFGQKINLKTFTNPQEAFEFIASEQSVALVITDEVMPGLNGNLLCDKVKAIKPALKFILVTGNPQNDDDLMYKTLRENRFYDFIRKPLDLEKKGADYLKLIQTIIA